MNSTFRHTFSTFKDSFSKWRVTSELNRSRLKEIDEKKKEEILRTHEDLTLRNISLKSVEDKMLSLKQRATKVATQYL